MLPGDAPGEEEFLSKETPPPLLWTGYYYKNVWILAQVARILGNEDDAAAYDQLAAAIRAALNDKWLDASGNHYATGSQTANIFPLALGVVPEANRQRVLQTLIDDILVKRGGHLRTGNLGTTCIMDALTPLGGGEAMFQVATSTDYPGWGYMVSRRATTIWESWGGVREGFVGYNTSEDSMVMFVTIERFFYNDIAGIQGPAYFGPAPFAPGFEDFHIKPHVLGDLTHAKATVRTVRGRILAAWKRGPDGLEMEVEIPVNSRARLSIPTLGLGGIVISENGQKVWDFGTYVPGVEGVLAGKAGEGDYVTLTLGSGAYRFRLTGN
jgi:alpha-L-rhamnosidase